MNSVLDIVFSTGAITKDHRLGDLIEGYFLSSGDQKFDTKVSAGLVSSEASLLACRFVSSSCAFCMVFSLCMFVP